MQPILLWNFVIEQIRPLIGCELDFESKEILLPFRFWPSIAKAISTF